MGTECDRVARGADVVLMAGPGGFGWSGEDGPVWRSSQGGSARRER
jgi:hypothetical protein